MNNLNKENRNLSTFTEKINSICVNIFSEVYFHFVGIKDKDINMDIVNKRLYKYEDILSIFNTRTNAVLIFVVSSDLVDNLEIIKHIESIYSRIKLNNNFFCLSEWPSDRLLQTYLIESFKGFNENMNIKSKEYFNYLSNGEKIEILGGNGTELELKLVNRKVFVEDYFSYYCDNFFQIPSGEVYVAPEEECSNGIIKISSKYLGLIQFDVLSELHISKGRLIKINVGNSKILTSRAESIFRIGEKIGEFGMGINPSVNSSIITPWIEKSLGTIHVGFGDNIHFGGLHKSDMHVDLTIPDITVFCNGTKIM
jgi:leucyl aminopeptidase (aminopeptidase T)